MNDSILDIIKDKSRGLKITEIELIMIQLLEYLSDNKIRWGIGIDNINDLIFLREHDFSELNKELCNEIFNWVKYNYTNKGLEKLTEVSINRNLELETIESNFYSALATLFKISAKIDIIPFLDQRLQITKTDFEHYELKNLKKSLEERDLNNQQIDHITIDKIIKRVNNFFKNENLGSSLKYGLKETITEHERSYSISWCLDSEKYIAPHKRTVQVGIGKLFISKETDLIKMSGSSPFEDWVKWFELAIDQQEEYSVLEIKYEKRKISKLKTLLNCSTPELLRLVDDKSLIIMEKEKFELERMKYDFDNCEIQSQIKILRRDKK